VALGLTIAGMLITLLVGWRLPRLEYQNEKVEAHFRKELVLSEDTLSKRIESELFPIFVTVRRNYYRLFNWSMGMDVWQTLFGLLAGNVALFFLANAYFDAPEVFALGMLTQSLQFFARVEGSMTYFIDRWPMLVGFIAVVIRLIEFERSVGVEALAARARAARQAGE
jgi:peptide/bleomycin uptake transporter